MYSWFSPRSPHTEWVRSGRHAVSSQGTQTTLRHSFLMRPPLTPQSAYFFVCCLFLFSRDPKSSSSFVTWFIPLLHFVLMWCNPDSEPSCSAEDEPTRPRRKQTKKNKVSTSTHCDQCLRFVTHTHSSSVKPVCRFTPPCWPRRMKWESWTGLSICPKHTYTHCDTAPPLCAFVHQLCTNAQMLLVGCRSAMCVTTLGSHTWVWFQLSPLLKLVNILPIFLSERKPINILGAGWPYPLVVLSIQVSV